MKQLVEIARPAGLEHMEALRDTAAMVAREIGFSSEQVARVELAVEEAVMNVILHAYPGAKGDVALSCSRDDGGCLVVMVTDGGIPFDPTAGAAVDKERPPGKRAPGGLGIDLMRHNADHLAYRRTKGKNMMTLLFMPESR